MSEMKADSLYRSKNLVGMKFGKLTVIERTAEKQEKYTLWRCRCECGNEVLVNTWRLMEGTVQDCGCVGAEDLSGRRFGMLEVLKKSDGRKYICRCDCGNEVTVAASDLLRGHKRSCGCSKKRPRGVDVTGMRSGKLVAIERTNLKRRGAALWRCKCDCGKELLTEGSNITGGRVQSCGCSRSKPGQGAVDLAGKRFGRLTAVRSLETKAGRNILWLCKCDCGNEIHVPTNRLSGGNTQSCGCLRAEISDPSKYVHFIDGTCVELLERTRLRCNNTSGYTGVQARGKRWIALITFKKKVYYLGIYDDIEDAARARKKAEGRLFGEFLEWYYKEFPDQKRGERTKTEEKMRLPQID